MPSIPREHLETVFQELNEFLNELQEKYKEGLKSEREVYRKMMAEMKGSGECDASQQKSDSTSRNDSASSVSDFTSGSRDVTNSVGSLTV